MQYIVTLNLNHNGIEYVPGDTVQLTDKEAEPLIASGVVSKDRASKPAAPAPESEPEAEQPAEPAVGGAPQQSGEPSVDTSTETEADTALDVTPQVETRLEDMKRPELEAMALSFGITEADAKAAPNKGALIELVNAARDAKAKTETPDLSANL